VAERQNKTRQEIAALGGLPFTRTHQSAVFLTYFSGEFTPMSVFLTAIAVLLTYLPGTFSAADRAMTVQLQVPTRARSAEKCGKEQKCALIFPVHETGCP
jgi:hypothetical protein